MIDERDMPMAGYLDPRGRALLRLRARGADGVWNTLVCEIDTGAEPMLLTSLAWVEQLGALIDAEAGEVLTFADGSNGQAIYIVFEIEWFGRIRRVDALAAIGSSMEAGFTPPGRRGRGANALLGRSLLANTRLTIDYGRASVAVEHSEPAHA